MSRKKLFQHRTQQPRTCAGKWNFIDVEFKRDTTTKHNWTAIRNTAIDRPHRQFLHARNLCVGAGSAQPRLQAKELPEGTGPLLSIDVRQRQIVEIQM